MNMLKNNGKGLWVWSALCLVALGLTGGAGCDLQATESQGAFDSAANPSATMARLFSPVIDVRLEPVKLVETTRLVTPVIEARLDSADSAGITLLR